MALKRLEVYQTELQTLVNANKLFTMGLNGWRWTEAKKKGRYCQFSCNLCSNILFLLKLIF